MLLSVHHHAYSDVRWRMLLAGLAANEHFAWKVAQVDYQSVDPTVSVCSSVGLTKSARSSSH